MLLLTGCQPALEAMQSAAEISRKHLTVRTSQDAHIVLIRDIYRDKPEAFPRRPPLGRHGRHLAISELQELQIQEFYLPPHLQLEGWAAVPPAVSYLILSLPLYMYRYNMTGHINGVICTKVGLKLNLSSQPNGKI